MALDLNNGPDSPLFLEEVIPTGDNEQVYGKFFNVKYEETLFAAKKVHPWDSVQDNREARDLYLEKCRTWSMLRHPNIVLFLGPLHNSITN